jgi:regulator of protease activity HflC (stomatin/prohibitin superfamily)
VRTLALLAWIAAVGMIIFTAIRASRCQGSGARTTVGVAVVVVIAMMLTTIGGGLVFIEPQERGVVISAIARLGYREQALQPGLNWIAPFAESVAAVIEAKGQAQSRLIQVEAEAKSLQMISEVVRQNTDLITYQNVSKLAPGIQVMLVPNNAPLILPVPTLVPPSPTSAALGGAPWRWHRNAQLRPRSEEPIEYP